MQNRQCLHAGKSFSMVMSQRVGSVTFSVMFFSFLRSNYVIFFIRPFSKQIVVDLAGATVASAVVAKKSLAKITKITFHCKTLAF